MIVTSGRINRVGFIDKSFGAPLLAFVGVEVGLFFFSAEIWSVALMLLTFVVFLLHWTGLAVRRLHDLGRSGRWAWLFLVPGIQLFLLLYLLVWKGGSADNEYGPEDEKEGWSSALISVLVSLVLVIAVGYYTVTNPDWFRSELGHRLEKVQEFQQLASEGDIEGMLPSQAREDEPPKPTKDVIDKKIAALSKRGKWTAEEFFVTQREDLMIIFASEFARFRRLCGRLPSPSQEGLFVFSIGRQAKVCPSWKGRVPRLLRDQFEFPIYLTKVSQSHMAIYTYGVDNTPGGEGKNRDYRMDIKRIE